MVVGSKGSGKSAFLNSLINKDLIKTDSTPEIEIYLINLDCGGSSQRISFIDTPGFGEGMNDTELHDSLIEYIKEQFDSYIEEETKIRRNVKYEDTRVHCMVYLISATGNGLKQRDIAFLEKASNFVNIIPVITKTEGMTKNEISETKLLIRDQIKNYKIRVFDFENQSEYCSTEPNPVLSQMMPFACVFPEQNGGEKRVRVHPKCVCEVDDPVQTDYSSLRDALLSSFTGALIEITDAELYENYRADALENILQE